METNQVDREQKLSKQYKLLPYCGEINDEVKEALQDIKAYLGNAILFRDISSITFWTASLNKYIKSYGFKFSKQDHITFIHILYDLITSSQLDYELISHLTRCLVHLLRKTRFLVPEKDLVLNWRPLFELYKKLFPQENPKRQIPIVPAHLQEELKELATCCSCYFPLSETKFVLREIKEYLCPSTYLPMSYGMELLCSFLPTPINGQGCDVSYELWFKELMNVWNACSNSMFFCRPMFNMIGSLAFYNIGYIDWEPYTAAIFSRILVSFNLPVNYKNYAGRISMLDNRVVTTWIVNTLGGGSKTQDYLDQLLKTVETYCRPVNVGMWTSILKLFLHSLTESFLLRIKRETIWRSRWCNNIPESYRLNDTDITRFVCSVQNVALNAMFNVHMMTELCTVFQNLAYLKPQIVIPPILERLYLQLDSVSETYKLLGTLVFTTAICRPLFEGAKTGAYKEGISHVIPLLFGILPCIDANDFSKSSAALRLIMAYATIVPFRDSSMECNQFEDLTSEEELACSSTAQFEEFVLQYLDKCLTLIENCALENTRLDRTLPDNHKNHRDNYFKNIIIHTTHRVMWNTSKPIFTAALKKVYNFCISRIFERKVAGKQVAKMLSTFSLINGQETLKLVVPPMCDYIIDFLNNNPDIQKEENLDNEFLYKLMILSQVIKCPGDVSIPYLPRLTFILERILHMTCKEASQVGCDILKNILKGFTHLHFRSCRKRLPDNQPPSLSVREWANTGVSVNDVEVDWYYPQTDELCCIEQLVHKFLLPELEIIDHYVNDQNYVTRDELFQTLNIIAAVLPINYLFAPWENTPFNLYNMKTPAKFPNIRIGISRFIYMPDGSNILSVLAEKLTNLQNVILRFKEDDTTSLERLILIWATILPTSKDLPLEKIIKQFMTHKLMGKDQNTLYVTVVLAIIKYNSRIFEARCRFTVMHELVVRNLLTLSVNHYGQIRKKAQCVIEKVLKHIPSISLLAVDMLADNLKIDTTEQHDKFKGTLFLMIQLLPQLDIIFPGYKHTKRLLPALVTSMPPEKLTTITLMESMTDLAFKYFLTRQHNHSISDVALLQAKKLWHRGKVMPVVAQISEEEIQTSLQEMCEANVKITEDYKELVKSLLSATNNTNFHWRNLLMVLDLLNILTHDVDVYSDEHVKFFLRMLIHDSHFVRKKAIYCVSKVLTQNRRVLKKNVVDPFIMARLEEKSAVEYEEIKIGYREDNQWLLYKPENIPTNETEWNDQRYSNNAYIGYYRWPRELKLYAPPNEQESLDKPLNEMSSVEKEFHNFFSDDENIAKLLTYYSMEPGKNESRSFRLIHFLLFKDIFRTFGDKYILPFRKRLTDLIMENQRSSQVCAAEIIAGIICGSKYWPYDKYQALMTWLIPLIHAAFDCAIQETMGEWISCFSFGLARCDVNKAADVINALTENPLKQDTTYKDVGRISTISSLTSHAWRIPYILHHLLECYKPHISHPYKQIRDSIGASLAYVFSMDIKIDGWNNTEAPLASEFVINYVLPQLDDLYQLTFLGNGAVVANGGILNGTDEMQVDTTENKRKDDVNFLRTICRWIYQTGVINRFHIHDEFYLLLPLLCFMTNYEQDAELKGLCNSAISVLAKNVATLPSTVNCALCAARETSKSISLYARLTCIEFLQVFVFFNMAFVSNSETWRTEVLGIVEKLLIDDRVEVRTKSGQLIGSLIHCDFIKTPETYMKKFSRMAKTRYTGDKTNLYIRHAGVIGLCSFISANPYDVPDYVPEVFVELNNHMQDPEPIPSTIRKTLGDFKRTHYNDWEMQRKKFTEEQISIYTDMVLPPTYYA